MHGKPLRGTLKLAWLWDDAGTGPTRQRRRRAKQVVGTCDLCGGPIRWGESYHVSGAGMAHLRCEWQDDGGAS